MARKRTSSDGGISLDSLMDALTNVVAVLILVLILVQADVTQKVQKFLDDLQPATPEEVALAKKLVDDLERKQRLAEARLLDKPATAEELDAEKKAVTFLEVSLEKTEKDDKELLADLKELQALEKKVSTERAAEEAQTATLQKEIARIEGLLDTTPVPTGDKPTIVNIPDSRPIPEGASMYYAMVNHNRIHIIDPHTPLTQIRRELERRKRDWLVEHKKIKGQPDRYIYDGTKIVAHFQDFDWGNARGQKIQILAEPTNYFLWLVIRPNLESGGTPLEEITQPNSEFVKSLPIIRNHFKSVLLYRVHTNSFPTYLAARELSEKLNIPAGWEINWNQEFRMPIPDLTVKRLKEPPPKDPKAPVAPPKPKPLKPRLD